MRLFRSHKRAFTVIPTMITPTVIILLVLLFSDGTSHPAKATSGSSVISGCGCRYGNSAQYLTILHFPSLHAEAAPHGGIS
ncbi:MAG TPA: hypothetical protein VIO58_07625 [Candidatus Methanoperedens sp.]